MLLNRVVTNRWRPIFPVLIALAGAGACRAHAPARLPASPSGVGPIVEAAPAPAVHLDPTNAIVEHLIDQLTEVEALLEADRLDAARVSFERALVDLDAVALRMSEYSQVRARVEEVARRLDERERLARDQALDQVQEGEPAALDAILDAATLLPTPEPALSDLVLATLRRAGGDFPIPVNGKVLSYIELFRGRLREWFQEGLRRSGRYLPMIEAAFRAEGLPLDLAYVALIESAFKPTALSRARAKGLWQFVRDTARRFGLREDWYVDERSDPEKATWAAARYLKSLYELFSGDWLLALASYNGGPGRVQRALARSGRRDFWALAAAPRLLPRETREYVPMILAAIIIAKAPQAFGFSVEPDRPLVYETVPLLQPLDLRRVAAWIGTSFQELLNLNPELRRWTTPPGGPAYQLKVPIGTADLLRARLATAPDDLLEPFVRHTVRRGETLASIARKHKVARADLAAANHLSLRARVRVGQQLVIPRPPALDDATVAAAAVRGGAASDRADPPDTELVRIVHRIRPGETLAGIARRYGTTVEALRRWNRLPTTRILAGRQLAVYVTRTVAAGLE